MKVLTTAGLTELIQLIKGAFISNTDVEQVTTVSIDSSAVNGSSNLITSDAVYDATHDKVAYSDTTNKILDGKLVANTTAVQTLGTSQVRNIYAGTTDMTAGTTALATGDIYVVYEE